MPTEIFNKKDKKKKKRRKKPRLLQLIVIVAALIGVYFLLTSQLFTIYNIKVEDNLRYSDYEIIDMAGVRAGDNLFKTRSSAVKKALMEDPYFESVNISRELPDTLVIKVKEKAGLLAVPLSGSYAIIDEDGKVLEMSDSTQGCTELAGVTLESGEPGRSAVPVETDLFSDAMQLVTAMEKNGLFFIRMEVTDTTDELYIFDSLCYKGTKEGLIENMESVKSILYDLNLKEISRGVITVGSDGYASFSPLTE